MDLLASYHSDSDDASEKQEFPNEVCSEAVKSKCSHNVDYFHLDCSSSDDDCENSKDDQENVRAMALILSDKPYNPVRPNTDDQNSDGNFKQNKCNMNFYSGKCPITPTFVKGGVEPESDDTEKNKSIYGTFPIKHVEESVLETGPECNSKTSLFRMSSSCDKLTVCNKKLKTDCDGTKNYNSYANLSDNFCNTQTECSSVQKSAVNLDKTAFSCGEQSKNYNEKSLLSGLPKKQIKTFNGHSGAVSCLRWCVPRYSHLLLSGSYDSSLKVWDIRSKKMVQDIRIPSSRIKAAQWMPCGTAVICGGFNKKAHIFDTSSSKELMTYSFSSYVYSIELHPVFHYLFVVGVKDKVLAFDTRNDSCEPIRKFESSRCGQVLDIKFLEDGNEFVCSTEIVSGDSADRTIMAWDFASGAQLSNQIFHERYTCPFLQVDPSYKSFVAQTNGNYIAIFSSQRPYKMNKNKRFEGHKVLGYPIGCDFSANGKYLASGDAEGGLYIYWNYTAHLVKKQDVKPGVPTTQVKWHPLLHTTMATSSWDGEVQLWQ